MSDLLFETDRLLYRKIVAEDVDAMHAVYSIPEVMKWVGDGKTLDRDQCAYWVEVTHNNYAKRGYGMSALVLRETRSVIGFCGLVHPGGQEETEIKYALLPAYWGQGLATEAAQAMLAYGEETFGMTRVIATVYPDNLASQRVMIKAGMQHELDRHEENGVVVSVYAWQPSETKDMKMLQFDKINEFPPAELLEWVRSRGFEPCIYKEVTVRPATEADGFSSTEMLDESGWAEMLPIVIGEGASKKSFHIGKVDGCFVDDTGRMVEKAFFCWATIKSA